MPNRLSAWIALILLGIVVFATSLNFGFVVYDDLPFVEENPYVNKGVTKDGVIWALTYRDLGQQLMHPGVENVWHPLPWISYMTDVEIFGENAGGFHLTNLLFHLCSTILVFELTRALFSKPWVAFFTAAFFCLHPMHVETVVWISERKGVMSGTFFFASILAYLRWTKEKKPLSYATSLTCFALGLMSKPSALILPLILMLLDLFPLRRGPAPEKQFGAFLSFHIREKWPFYVLTMATFATGILLQGGGTHRDFMGTFPLFLRLETMATSFLFYLKRMIWPMDLTFSYSYLNFPHVRYVHIALTIMTAVVTFLIWKNRKKIPSLFFAWGWFLICILPVAGFVYVGVSYTADRYSYLALNGIFTALGLLGAWGASKHPRLRPFLIGSAFIAITTCGWLSFRQAQTWKNNESMFTQAIHAQPRQLIGYLNLAGIFQQKEDYQTALKIYQKAEKIQPRDHMLLYNMGLNYSRTGSTEKSFDYYRRSVDAYDKFPPAHFNLGLYYRNPESSDYHPDKAMEHIARACELTKFRNPRYSIIMVETLAERGKMEDARALWKQIIRFPIKEPEVQQRVQNIGRVLGLQN